MRTSIPGVFACGDIRSKEVRQAIVAAGEGAVAAVQAIHFVESLV
jgi:thioredoxin reductase (NADPH)